MSELKSLYGALAASVILALPVGCGKSEKQAMVNGVSPVTAKSSSDFLSSYIAAARDVPSMDKNDAVLVRTMDNHFWFYVGKLAKKVDSNFSADNAKSYFKNHQYIIEMYDDNGDGNPDPNHNCVPNSKEGIEFYINNSLSITSTICELQEKMGIRITDLSRGIMEATSRLTF